MDTTERGRCLTLDKNFTGRQNTELQSNQTEAGTALAMAMAALYYRFVGALPHHL